MNLIENEDNRAQCGENTKKSRKFSVDFLSPFIPPSVDKFASYLHNLETLAHATCFHPRKATINILAKQNRKPATKTAQMKRKLYENTLHITFLLRIWCIKKPFDERALHPFYIIYDWMRTKYVYTPFFCVQPCSLVSTQPTPIIIIHHLHLTPRSSRQHFKSFF